MNPETGPTVAKENAARKSLRDTVYIVQHDTIYKTLPVDENYSMDGYATNNMVLLLDVSGSMNTPEKLPLLKETLLSLLGIMREEDQISVIAFSKKANVLLKPVSFKNEQKIRQAIEKLESSGKTDANAGLKAAYKIADGNYIRGGNNRIILATDGEFPVSEATLKLVKGWAEQDIFLTIFNFGKNTSAKVLENLALLGHGNYEYISTENARLKLLREAKSKKRK
jgi:Mg-chelatase subunit ChlD